jgi:hypothetical protein
MHQATITLTPELVNQLSWCTLIFLVLTAVTGYWTHHDPTKARLHKIIRRLSYVSLWSMVLVTEMVVHGKYNYYSGSSGFMRHWWLPLLCFGPGKFGSLMQPKSGTSTL